MSKPACRSGVSPDCGPGFSLKSKRATACVMVVPAAIFCAGPFPHTRHIRFLRRIFLLKASAGFRKDPSFPKKRLYFNQITC